MPERLSRIWVVCDQWGILSGSAYTNECEAREYARAIKGTADGMTLYGSVMDLDCEQEKFVAQGDEACREHAANQTMKGER